MERDLNWYMAEIERLEQERSPEREKKDSAEAILSQYNAAVEDAVKKLKAEYGYDDAAGRKNAADKNITAIDAQIRMNKIQFVAEAMARLFCAYPEDAPKYCETLGTVWGIDVSYTNVGKDNFAACFDAFAKKICSSEWWQTHNPSQQMNGMTWVWDYKEYDWQPEIGIGIPQELLSDMSSFKVYVDNKTKSLAEAWAGKLVERMQKDKALQQALFEALRDTLAEER